MSTCGASDNSNVVWLVAGLHSTTGDRTANDWRRYAHDSRRGVVMRMNGEAWTPTSQPNTETGAREAKLSTLAKAVENLKSHYPSGSLPTGSHLVMLMHGTFQEQDNRAYGILQSRGQPVSPRELQGIENPETAIFDRNGQRQEFRYLAARQYVHCVGWQSAPNDPPNRINADEIRHIGDGPDTPAIPPQPKDNRWKVHGMIVRTDPRNHNILITQRGHDPELVHAYPMWDGRFLPLDWGEARLKNAHYRNFVAALRGWQEISHVHLYGCQVGRWDQQRRYAPWGLLDLAKDIDKGVWAFTNFTAVDLWTGSSEGSERHWKFRIRADHDNESSATVVGACYRWGCPKGQGRDRVWPDSGYRKVFLCANMGRLLGFSVRAIEAYVEKDGKLTGARRWIVEIVKSSLVEQWYETARGRMPDPLGPPPESLGLMHPARYRDGAPLKAKTCLPEKCPFKANNSGPVC